MGEGKGPANMIEDDLKIYWWIVEDNKNRLIKTFIISEGVILFAPDEPNDSCEDEPEHNWQHVKTIEYGPEGPPCSLLVHEGEHMQKDHEDQGEVGEDSTVHPIEIWWINWKYGYVRIGVTTESIPIKYLGSLQQLLHTLFLSFILLHECPICLESKIHLNISGATM